MADAGIVIGENITEHLVVPALKKFFRPIFCFQTIADDFQDQSKKLIAIRERVENEMQRDRDNGLTIYDSVEEWMKKVNDDVMPEVQCMLNELLGGNKRCFSYSWCPNWTCHYSFSKQVCTMVATMKTLCEEGNSFSSLSHPPALHQDIIGSSSSAGFMHSRSSRSAFDQIMDALKRDDINLIGLYGRAGAGKTTMAQLVREEAKKLFNRVIMVPVSEHPQVRSQQGFIADFLGLQFDQQESEQGRAAKLQLRLKNGEKILVIFDDVQKEFNLGAVIGIPSSDSGCKILLTTHAEIQCLNFVRTQKDFQLGVLSEDEASSLFKRVAGVSDEDMMHGGAKDALVECNGLPKAVVAVGTVLNGKGIPEWRETLQQLNATKFKIIAGLKEDVERLSQRQNKASIKIKTAKRNVEEIYPDVEKWLKDVERVTNDVEQYENELSQNRWCFDELHVKTKVEALTNSIKVLYAEGNFDQVSHHTPLVQDMGVFPSEDFMFTKAARSAFDQIMESLRTDGMNMIGLYGMGGIGKTTLAIQVQKEVVRHDIFDRVVMVTVSQKPDVENMQAKMADFLGIELRESSVDGRASKLNMRLKTEKILIILDDVWKWFHLGTIGVMLNDFKGCKVLLTTRRKDVCISMDSQKDIQLDLFSDEEAQIFFKKKTGLSSESMLNDLAKQIVGECNCLPIALETVGAALKKKGKDEWTEALEKLRNARLLDIIGVDDDEKNAYKCLQVSYDYLKGLTQAPQAQFILLLCSLFPEDYAIEVEDLTKYAFGLKLFENVKSIEDVRRKVRVTIRLLKASCLLLDIEGEDYVKIHDVVRDVMLWIGGTESQERNILTVRDVTQLKDLIKKRSFQNCRAVSFMPDVIPKLSKDNKLECPNLEAVLIFSKGEHELRVGFFEQMKFLKVLDCKGAGRWTRCKFAMPQSLQSLEYLSTLMLRHCECSNSSILGELRQLKILSLSGCKIDCGVEVVSGLKKLRFLDLLGLEAEIRMFTSNVIQTFVKLEELHGYTFAKRKDGEGRSSSLFELKLLSKLVALSVKIEDVRCLPTGFCFPKLRSYYIRMGVDMYGSGVWSESTRQRRRLEQIGNIEDELVMITTCKKLLPTVQDLYFEGCKELRSLDAFNSHSGGFLQWLERLEVKKCNKMEWLFEFQVNRNVSNNNKENVHLQFLKILKLKWLTELKQIWKGLSRSVSLCNLTEINLWKCSKLTWVFSSPLLATSLQQLEILQIAFCPALEEIISKRGGNDDEFSCCCCFTNLRYLSVNGCGKLKTIFPATKPGGGATHFHNQSCCRLPKLQEILLRDNRELEHVFGHQTQAEGGVECPSLQVLVVTDSPKMSSFHVVATQLQAPSPKPLEDICMDNIQGVEEQLRTREDDMPQNRIICFSSLKRVELRGCSKLKRVFTTSFATSLHHLEELIVQRCSKLEQVMSKAEDGKELSTGVCFENLKTLEVSKCKKLKTIFPISSPLPKLERLQLESNAELEHVVGLSDSDSTWQYPFLTNLYVAGCPKVCRQFAGYIQNMSTSKAKCIKLGDIKGVEAVMQIEGQRENDIDESFTCYLENLSLRNLEDLKCIWRGPTQNVCFVSLHRLEVIDCNRLKHLLETTIATTLPRLKELIVQRCSELEQVILVKDGKELEDDATTKVGFKNLQVLHVSNCEKLKTIFSVFTSLPKLDCLRLESNPELETVFGQSDCYTSYWTSLEVLAITGCQKLCTQFVAIVKSQVQAKSTTSSVKFRATKDDQLVQHSRRREAFISNTSYRFAYGYRSA